MALCLARGLINGKGEYVGNEVCRQYTVWLKSNPFDMG